MTEVEGSESEGSRRLELVRTAQQQWIAALTDLGGRNTLLYYKDRRAGTLDLAQATRRPWSVSPRPAPSG
jgi:hypothetical protein